MTQHTPPTDQQLDEIDTRAASLHEYATLTDGPLQADADQLTGEDVPALLAEVHRLREERDELIRQRDQIAMDTLKAIAADGEPEPSGTKPCGHDDYHDAHEWADRPHVWCPGIGYDAPAASAAGGAR